MLRPGVGSPVSGSKPYVRVVSASTPPSTRPPFTRGETTKKPLLRWWPEENSEAPLGRFRVRPKSVAT